jgi:hypothetical protein
MIPPALRLMWKIVVAGFALWGVMVTLFVFAYGANLLPARVQRSIRAGVGISRATWNRQPRTPSPRQTASQRTPQQLPPVDSDSKTDSDEDAEPSPAAERGHRVPPHN